MQDNQNNNFGDALNMASLFLAIQNLYENRAQTRHNDVQTANDKQAEYLLSELAEQFEKQNRMLETLGGEIRALIDDRIGDMLNNKFKEQNKMIEEVYYMLKNSRGNG